MEYPFNRDICKIFAILLSVFFALAIESRYCCAEDIALEWNPSPSKKVVGYKVHSRTEDGGYYSIEDVGNVKKHVVRDLSKEARYVFFVTAYDASGFESIHSNEVSWGSRPAGIGSSSSGSGCLIAAVAYGGPQAREVILLKRFRDRFLEPNPPGRFVIQAYEWVSPPLADLARRNETFRRVTKWSLGPHCMYSEHPRRSAPYFYARSAGGAIGFRYAQAKEESNGSRKGLRRGV